ncbi:MAG: mechanosensitive ion channel family protein [Dehalococcoidales bacterium]|nr:mechanosensitive ion channel family protein [Dehalococcoidales bacterium]
MLPQFVEGTPLLEAAWAVGIFALSVLVAWLVLLLMRRVEQRQKAHRRTNILPRLVGNLARSVFLLIVCEGLILALAAPTYLVGWHVVLKNASIAVLITFGFFGLARVIAAFLEWSLRSRGVRRKALVDEGLIRFLRRIVLLIVYLLGGLVLLQYLKIDITPLIAGLGIGGLAVALALQPTLGNFFAGTQIVTDRVVRVGDYIELNDGTRGYVTDVGWRSTRIRTPFNNLVIIPNSNLANSIITNYYGPSMEIGVIVNCGISYDSDLAHVERVAIEVCREVINDLDEAVKTFEPWFGFEDFGDSNINFWLWLQAVDRIASFRVKSELIKRLHARLRKEGITINYPVRRLVYDDAEAHLPPSLRSPRDRPEQQ